MENISLFIVKFRILWNSILLLLIRQIMGYIFCNGESIPFPLQSQDKQYGTCVFTLNQFFSVIRTLGLFCSVFFLNFTFMLIQWIQTSKLSVGGRGTIPLNIYFESIPFLVVFMFSSVFCFGGKGLAPHGNSLGRALWCPGAWSLQCWSCRQELKLSWRSWWWWETSWRCPWTRLSTYGGFCRPHTHPLKIDSCTSWRYRLEAYCTMI